MVFIRGSITLDGPLGAKISTIRASDSTTFSALSPILWAILHSRSWGALLSVGGGLKEKVPATAWSATVQPWVCSYLKKLLLILMQRLILRLIGLLKPVLFGRVESDRDTLSMVSVPAPIY